jgi:2-polyprenyl-6-methoxyphenol hydroxylase-like FAD-dependent oxidoreductase
VVHGHRNRAVVLGASMGGLLAARTLADFYESVTVVERDQLPEGPMSRRGVPQGKHPHALLGKAVEIIGDLFPGIFDQLVADGAVKWDDGDLSRFRSTFSGHLMVRSTIPDPTSLTDYHLSRPLLEHAVLRAVRDIPNVKILEQHDVVGITADDDRARVTGARVHRHGSVDLEQLGYRAPRVDDVHVQIAYATMPVRIPPGTIRELVVGNYPIASRSSMLGMLACENDMYLVLGGTVGGGAAPVDRNELLDFIEPLAPRHIMAALRTAEPLGDVVQYRIPSNRWRRYDKLSRVPDGLLVFGDAICSFNPIYGQGITVAALEAQVLRDCLHRGTRDLPRRFYRKAAEKIRVAWQTAVSSDLALPQVPGRRPLSVRIMNTYMDWVLTATETDPTVAQQFLRVVWMLDAPSALFRPEFVGRIAKAMLTGARNPEQVEHLEHDQLRS